MPKIVDHEERRNAIADAVLSLIAEEGTQMVTTRNAAKKAGWSTGAVNHYFSSRDELMLGALRRAARLQGQEFKRIQNQADSTPMERLHRMIESILPLDERRMAMTRIFLEYYAAANGSTNTHEEVAQYLRNWRKVTTRMIQACIDKGSITTSRNAESLAVEIVALTDGLSMHALLDPATLEPIIKGGTLTIFIDQEWGPVRLVSDPVPLVDDQV